MSGTRRETIHISMGGTSNAVTSHLLNLEGLSATSADSLGALCDPLVTHQVDATDEVWVPRVLWIDEAFRIQKTTTRQLSTKEEAGQSTRPTTATELAKSVWDGNIQEFPVDHFNLENFAKVDNVVANLSFNSNSNVDQQITQQQQPSWLSSWHQTANQLAYAPYSQYRVSGKEQHHNHYPYSTSDQLQGTGSQQQSRYVDWNDLEEEPEEEEEEMAALRERQRQQQMQQWQGERLQLEEQLSSVWNTSPNVPPSQDDDEDRASFLEVDLQNLSWFDFWMPPYPSKLSQYTHGLPSTSWGSSFQAPPLFSYNISSHANMLDDIWEKLRFQLEHTDSCQGFTVMTEESGIYAGIADWLLQELSQECRAAGRWVFQVHSNEYDFSGGDADGDGTDQDENNILFSPTTELSRAQTHVRNQVQRALALTGLSDHAHILLPLVLPSRKKKSLFRSSAELAMALETATLPYRCQKSGRTLVAWNSMSSYEEGTTPGMSVGDYLMALQPSPRYSLLELDSLMLPSNHEQLLHVVMAGTSMEQDPRLRQSLSSVNTEYPGSWLMDAAFAPNSSSAPPGILTSLSPGHIARQDRSLHHHFGLSTCLRSSLSAEGAMPMTNQQYLTCIMEGMGIRYRPETAFGLVTNQSLSQLTGRGHKYGAGSYWHQLLGNSSSTGSLGLVDRPVLSVLGNTTRMYPYLHTTASEMKDALKSSKCRGFYQREVSNGILPEMEDCDEALEYCWGLCDVYEAPHGSGLTGGEDEEYFEL